MKNKKISKKTWKKLSYISIIPFILFFIWIIFEMIVCMKQQYPLETLGVTMRNWKELFKLDLYISFICNQIILLPSFCLLILSIYKVRKE